MKKMAISFIFLITLSTFTFAENIFTVTEGNSVTIYHNDIWANCASLFAFHMEMDDSLITIFEVDTTSAWATCMCNYNLSLTISDLDPGAYVAELYSYCFFDSIHGDGFDTIHISTLNFTIENVKSISLLESTNSGCLNKKSSDMENNDSLYIITDGDNLTAHLLLYEKNCGLEPEWSHSLINDTLFVTVADTGQPADCLCPFEITATFGPFKTGAYVFALATEDLWCQPEILPLEFTIGSVKNMQSGAYISNQFQSECNPSSIRETAAIGESFTLSKAYPNPFNPMVYIPITVHKKTDVTIIIYDAAGRFIEEITAKPLNPGHYTFIWNGTGKSSGVYFVKINEHSQKIVLLK